VFWSPIGGKALVWPNVSSGLSCVAVYWRTLIASGEDMLCARLTCCLFVSVLELKMCDGRPEGIALAACRRHVSVVV
jgi:hypothetical protein